MNVPELVLGAILGVVIGAPLGALVRPHIAWLEKRSRRTWNVDPLIQHCERDPVRLEKSSLQRGSASLLG